VTAFKLDENLPLEVADLLRADGHDVTSVLDQGLGGEPDPKILRACSAEKRALFTIDTDFANVLEYPPADHAGIVVLRLARQDRASVLAAVERIRDRLLEEKLDGKLWILEESRVRIRG